MSIYDPRFHKGDVAASMPVMPHLTYDSGEPVILPQKLLIENLREGKPPQKKRSVCGKPKTRYR